MEQKKIVLIRDCLLTDEQVEMFRFVEEYGARLEVVDHHREYTEEEHSAEFFQFETQGPDSLPENPAVTEAVKDAHVVISYFSPVHSSAIDAAEKLQGVCVLRSGVENVNAKYAAQCGVPVINVPGRLAVLVSEFTIGMILAETRNLARAHANLVQGVWQTQYVNSEYSVVLKGKTIGLVGMGAVGSRVARVLKAMEANVIVYDPYLPASVVEEQGCKSVSLDELCRRSDVVSIHYRLTAETKGMFGKAQFDQMKPHAYLINSARAGLVDEAALYEALRDHKIGGAALDVFHEEPLSADYPLLALDNVTLTPHIAGVSSDEFQVTFDIMKDALISYLETGVWKNVVKM